MMIETETIIEEHLQNLNFSDLTRIKLINASTHGQVWHFKHQHTNNSYAVKILKQENPEQSVSTLKEIENLQKVQNSFNKPPCFLDFYGYVITEEKNNHFENISVTYCYLIFDMADGSLAHYIQSLKKNKNGKQYLNFDDYYKYSMILIEGMAFLQTINITHRDIKPENILLKKELNNSYSIKIADFSESKFNTPNLTLQNMTIKGTPSYLSPELFHCWIKQKDLEHNPYKSDVYSLGLTLLELGTLEKVLDGESRKAKEADIDPKTSPYGPFDDKINNDLENLIKIYHNDKKIKDFAKILNFMLIYKEIYRLDFLELLALLQAEKLKHSISPSFHDSVHHAISFEKIYLEGVKVENRQTNFFEESKKSFERHKFDICLKNNNLNIHGIGNELVNYTEADDISSIFENISKIKEINNILIRTQSNKGPSRYFKLIERILICLSKEIKHIQIHSTPSHEIIEEKNSPYCIWMQQKFYIPRQFDSHSISIIHKNKLHWDIGVNNAEAQKLMEFASNILLKSEIIETISIVLVGGTYLKDLTLKSTYLMLDAIKTIKRREIKHFKFHLEGLVFSKENFFFQEIASAFFDKKHNLEIMDSLESLHIGFSSESSFNEKGLKEIIDKQTNLRSLSLYLKYLKNDNTLIEINEAMNESLFVHLENLTIGLHFEDDFEPTSIECQLKRLFRTINSFYSESRSNKKLKNFSFLLHSFYPMEDSFFFMRKILECQNLLTFDIYWKNIDSGISVTENVVRKQELDHLKKSSPQKYFIFYFDF